MRREIAGIAIRKKIPGQRGYEYFLTEMGKELLPVVASIGEWGMRWARGKMDDTDLDLELLMLYLQRSIVADKLPGDETVIRFKFTDISQFSDWWIVTSENDVDVCVRDPGKDVDQHCLNILVRHHKAESLGHTFGRGAATDIQKIGRLEGLPDNVHARHA